MEKEQKHPAAALIVSSMGKDAPEEGDEHSENEGQMAATQELMDALKEGDHEKFASALEAFIQMCQ